MGEISDALTAVGKLIEDKITQTDDLAAATLAELLYKGVVSEQDVADALREVVPWRRQLTISSFALAVETHREAQANRSGGYHGERGHPRAAAGGA